MKVVATHDGPFHADDVFSIAAFEILFGDISVIRTRDMEKIKTADIAVDVGRIYDPEACRFDHHQEIMYRENKIPYAGFGLMWKHYGTQIAGGEEEAKYIEQKLVLPIDAGDNGVAISKPLFEGVSQYAVYNIVSSFEPTHLEGSYDMDAAFFEAVKMAKLVLSREIAGARALVDTKRKVKEVYENAENKALLVFEDHFSGLSGVVQEYKDVVFIVSPYNKAENSWSLRAIKKGDGTFENRKDLPENWAGKEGEEFQKLTGVSGAKFCHLKRFAAFTTDKESALALAKIALRE